jgi:hypothetical protein
MGARQMRGECQTKDSDVANERGYAPCDRLRDSDYNPRRHKSHKGSPSQ